MFEKSCSAEGFLYRGEDEGIVNGDRLCTLISQFEALDRQGGEAAKGVAGRVRKKLEGRVRG